MLIMRRRLGLTVAGLLSLTLMLLGCASMPGMAGHIRSSVSTFDGSKELSMEPAFVCETMSGPCNIKLSLLRRSTMEEGHVVLDVLVSGIERIQGDTPLRIKIDGEVLSPLPIDKATEHSFKDGVYLPGRAFPTDRGKVYLGDFYIPPQGWSSRRFIVDTAFIERMVSGKEVFVRVELGRRYAEGAFSLDGYSTLALPAFKSFIAELERTGEQVKR